MNGLRCATRPTRARKQWQSGFDNNAARFSADELAGHCRTLFLAPPDDAAKLQRFGSSFDIKLSETYNPDRRIQLVRASRRENEERQAQPPGDERNLRSFSFATPGDVDRRPRLVQFMSAAGGDVFNSAKHAFMRAAKLPPGASSGRPSRYCGQFAFILDLVLQARSPYAPEPVL